MLQDTGNKYQWRKAPEHPKANSCGWVLEHIAIAEEARGRFLPDGAEVHHFNGARSDNRNRNLVVCQDRSYHRLLHVRQAALAACGHVDWRKCKFCKQYAPVTDLIMGRVRVNGYAPAPYHQNCQTQYRRSWRRARGIPSMPWKGVFGNKNAVSNFTDRNP